MINPGKGRTGLMRVGQYLVNGDGVVLAEPEELKRQTYGLGQKKLSLPKCFNSKGLIYEVKSNISQLRNQSDPSSNKKYILLSNLFNI